jgi:hypothetical protein
MAVQVPLGYVLTYMPTALPVVELDRCPCNTRRTGRCELASHPWRRHSWWTIRRQSRQLSDCDLLLDRVYKTGAAGNIADDPLGKLSPGVGNSGGFRPMGSLAKDAVRLVVLYTSGAEPDWPDELDLYTARSPTSGTTALPAANCTTP